MKYHIKVYKAQCNLEEFTINNIKASTYDFGEGQDESSETAEPYCCGNYQWTGRPSTKEVLEKYEITQEEYDEIIDALEDKLSFGVCCWCQ